MGAQRSKHVAVRMDDIDRAILNELQSNGRMTNADLASIVGLSPSAALRRVKALEESGIIERYSAQCDPAAIGRATTVFVEISLATQSAAACDAFEAAIADCPEVMSCHLMAGNADYLVQIACKDVDDYERIHRANLTQLPSVSRIRSSFALRPVLHRHRFDF